MSNKEIAIIREVIVKVTQLLAGKGLRVTQQGASAFVQADARTGKPLRVNIPHIPDEASDELILAIQGFIDHEVGHVLFTEFSYKAKERIADKRMDRCHDMAENPFVERMMAGKFPGAKHNMERLHGFFIEKIIEPELIKAKGDEKRVFAILLGLVVRALGGQKTFEDWLKKAGHWDSPLVKAFVDGLPAAAITKLKTAKSSRETYEAAEMMHAVLFPPPPPAPPAPPSSKPKEKTKADGKGANKDLPEDEEDEGEGGDSSAPEDKSELTEPEGEEPPADEDEEAEPPAEPEEEETEDELEEPPADAGKPSSADPDESDENSDDAGGEDGDDGSSHDPAEPADDDAGERDDDHGSAGEDDEPADDGEDDDGEPVGPPVGEDDDDGEDESPASSGDDDSGDEPASGGQSDDDGADEGGSDEVDEPAEPEPAGAGSSKFQDGDTDLEPTDFSEALSAKITDEASRETRDADYSIFTKDFDKIEPYPTEAASKIRSQESIDLAFTAFDDEVRHMVGPMQKDIERLMAARSQVMRVPGYRSGKLHAGNLHRLATNDDRVFRRNHEAKSKDTAVSLVMDNSGSMGGRPMRTAMLAGYALSQTLERVGIAHEAIGFTTMAETSMSAKLVEAEEARLGTSFSRIEPLYLPIYKGWDERLSPTVKHRFASAANQQNFLKNNVDGESVEVAAQRLSKRREGRKVLIVLSDGMPAAQTNNYRSAGKELNSHLHKVVKEATKQGIEVIGIGIMSDAVKTFYPKYMVLDDIAKLPSTVMGELKRILTL